MRGRRVDVTEAELAVLEVLWDRGPCPARAVVERLYPKGGPSAGPTVQKLLERLEGKGFVGRDRSGPVQTFAARVGRDELIDRRLRAVADELCGGSLASLVSHLVRGRRLTKGDRAGLRAYLDALEDEPGPDPGRS
jgi:BlaI family penicillinase repressor